MAGSLGILVTDLRGTDLQLRHEAQHLHRHHQGGHRVWKKNHLKKLPPDEREQDDPTLASAQLFPNILEHRGPGSRLVRFLLRLHRLPGSSPSLP